MEEIVKQQKELLGSESCKYTTEFLNNSTDAQEQGECQRPKSLQLVPPEKLVRIHLVYHTPKSFYQD